MLLYTKFSLSLIDNNKKKLYENLKFLLDTSFKFFTFKNILFVHYIFKMKKKYLSRNNLLMSNRLFKRKKIFVWEKFGNV